MSTFFTPRGGTLPPLTPETIPDSFSEPASGKRPWYRRTWFLAVVIAAVVVGASVIADLPHQATPAALAAQATTLVNSVDTDIRTCTFAVHQSYTIYGRQQAGTLTSSQRSQVPNLLSQNEQACSFANQAVVNLGTITVPSGAAGTDLNNMITSVEVWMTSDAVAAMDDMQKLIANPADVSATKDLAKQEGLLRQDKGKADTDITAAVKALGGAHIPDPSLPVTPRP
jgi:hypothetical protein